MLDVIPALRIQSVFLPMREVGGDFYLCRILPSGAQRILIGDVSGKGAAAAMTATLLTGAAEERPADSPAQLLDHLNRVLARSLVGGFATCLALDVLPNGQMTLANAGHIPPYLDGRELPLENALPLGLDPQAAYAESTSHLAPNQLLTLMTDGVLEARNAARELFGFDPTAAISTQSAEEIAYAAQAFGQDDDITVLTITTA